jgi:F-type H+-transporting ATPase subunit gamma
MALKHAGEIGQNYEGIGANPHFDGATKIGEDISRDFLNGKYDEVYLTYNIFNSPLSQHPTFKKIIPIEGETLVKGGTKLSASYLFEPPQEELLDFLIPKYLYFRIYFALLENSAGEHGARMTAMENATKNANEMIDHYTLLRNRARQANITTELIEIVSGAEVLKN